MSCGIRRILQFQEAIVYQDIKVYDANGKETADVANAKIVKTNYLSKDVNPSLVIAAYNKDAEVTDKIYKSYLEF